MKKYLVAMVLTAAWVAAQPNTLTPREKKDGWILLFDGKTLKGWVDPRQKTPPGDAWEVAGGCIHAVRNPRITEDLFTQRKFRDFDLAFEWRISPGGNSGVKYRIQDTIWIVPPKPHERFEQQVERSLLEPIKTRPARGQDYVVGFEYQITDDTSNRDAKSNAKHTAGALYDMVAPTGAVLKPVGEFNESRIVVRGEHVEHWLNGVKVVDTFLNSPAAMEGINKRWAVAPQVLALLANQPKRDCPISLQNHGDDAWFRGIRIRILK
jgi:hypothetical protein